MHDGVIRSDARMTYTAVNAILTDKDPETIAKYRELVPMFELMRELFEILNARRHRRGSVDFDLPEAQVVLNEEGFIEDIVASERNVAHRLIEEFMLLANETVAGASRDQRHAGALSHPRAARSAEGPAVRGVHQRVRIHRWARRKAAVQAEALPEAGRRRSAAIRPSGRSRS